jgi:cytochrome c oxidase subunit III
MSATTIPVAAAQEAEFKLPDRGTVGMLCLILTETALFSIFVVAYVFYIGKSLSGPYPKDVLTLPIWATVCLLSSSVTVELAVRGLEAGSLEGGSMARFQLWLAGTVLLGLEFLHQTAREWYKLIYHEHLTISTNLFGTTYYSLVGLHATHVVIGLSMLSLVLILALIKVPLKRHQHRIHLVSWYWHFVDVVWIVVFTVVYVIGR